MDELLRNRAKYELQNYWKSVTCDSSEKQWSVYWDKIKPKKQIMDRIIYNEPATVVFWDKDDKTVVKATEGDIYSPEFGFLIAYFEKHSGMSKTQVNKFMKKLKKDYKDQMTTKNKSK